MKKPETKVLITWTAAVALAAGAATTAVAQTSGGSDVLSEQEVSQKLAGDPQDRVITTGVLTGSQIGDAKEEELSSEAGKVFVKCKDGKVTHARLAPAPGWTNTSKEVRPPRLGDRPNSHGESGVRQVSILGSTYHYGFAHKQQKPITVSWSCEEDTVTFYWISSLIPGSSSPPTPK